MVLSLCRLLAWCSAFASQGSPPTPGRTYRPPAPACPPAAAATVAEQQLLLAEQQLLLTGQQLLLAEQLLLLLLRRAQGLEQLQPVQPVQLELPPQLGLLRAPQTGPRE